MKIPVKRGAPLKLWYEPWGEVWYDRIWPDFASPLSYDAGNSQRVRSTHFTK